MARRWIAFVQRYNDEWLVDFDVPLMAPPLASTLLLASLCHPGPADRLSFAEDVKVGADRLNRTTFRTTLFSADDSTAFLGSSAVGFVVLLGDREVNLGLVQSALRKALATLEGTWGPRGRVPGRPPRTMTVSAATTRGIHRRP